jgi:hypothetical protein
MRNSSGRAAMVLALLALVLPFKAAFELTGV